MTTSGESLPEITLKAIILSIILTIALAAANAYLGLKVGTTVSASIPAAVISMGILRLFRRSNILENNIVQTAASSGEAVVGGVSFIIPALILLGYWQQFNYWETAMIALSGGLFGVLCSVFLRRVLLAEKTLRFPEGTAIGNVLKASTSGTKSMRHLMVGSLVGGTISFCQNGLEIFANSLQLWFRAGSTVIGLGTGFDAALIAAGYIVGVNVAISTMIGVVIGWVIGVPYFAHAVCMAAPTGCSSTDIAMQIWHDKLRYIGVGVMLVGGLWTLVTFLKPMAKGIRASIRSLKIARDSSLPPIPRVEKDLPLNYVLWLILLLCIPMAMIFWHFTAPEQLAISASLRVSTIVIAIIFSLVGGFVFSSICGYFTGLVGSTNNPLSGMALSALIIISLILFMLLDHSLNLNANHTQALHAAALAIVIGAIVSSAAAITNDTIQDLKAGQMVGATPWKQQLMLMLGTTVAAFVTPEILNLLFNAYGIGGVFPHPGMDPKQMLAAPQAGLMAALVQGIFGHHLPWDLLYAGFAIAFVCIIIDSWLKRRNTRLPVLAVALGIYLPLEASVPLAIGGFLTWFVDRRLKQQYDTPESRPKLQQAHERGLILACGVVAGAALMGVILAIPFALAQSSDVLSIVKPGFAPIAEVLSVMVTILLLGWLYRGVCKKIQD